MRYFALFLIFNFFQVLAYAQSGDTVEMADRFRAEGKIYVVLVIILIIISGLFYYLYRIDRKVSKLEDQMKD